MFSPVSFEWSQLKRTQVDKDSTTCPNMNIFIWESNNTSNTHCGLWFEVNKKCITYFLVEIKLWLALLIHTCSNDFDLALILLSSFICFKSTLSTTPLWTCVCLSLSFSFFLYHSFNYSLNCIHIYCLFSLFFSFFCYKCSFICFIFTFSITPMLSNNFAL